MDAASLAGGPWIAEGSAVAAGGAYEETTWRSVSEPIPSLQDSILVGPEPAEVLPVHGTKRKPSRRLAPVKRVAGVSLPSNRESLRGVTSGVRSTTGTPSGGTCWVFVDKNLDVLLGALSHQALSITRVFVADLPTRAIMAALVLSTGAQVAPWDFSLALQYTPCTIALVSYRVNPKFLAEMGAVGVLLSNVVYRRLPPCTSALADDLTCSPPP